MPLETNKEANPLTVIGTNAGGAAVIGAYLPTILEAVPSKYQPFVSAGMAALAILAGLFQKQPKRK